MRFGRSCWIAYASLAPTRRPRASGLNVALAERDPGCSLPLVSPSGTLKRCRSENPPPHARPFAPLPSSATPFGPWVCAVPDRGSRSCNDCKRPRHRSATETSPGACLQRDSTVPPYTVISWTWWGSGSLREPTLAITSGGSSSSTPAAEPMLSSILIFSAPIAATLPACRTTPCASWPSAARRAPWAKNASKCKSKAAAMRARGDPAALPAPRARHFARKLPKSEYHVAPPGTPCELGIAELPGHTATAEKP